MKDGRICIAERAKRGQGQTGRSEGQQRKGTEQIGCMKYGKSYFLRNRIVCAQQAHLGLEMTQQAHLGLEMTH